MVNFKYIHYIARKGREYRENTIIFEEFSFGRLSSVTKQKGRNIAMISFTSICQRMY